MSLDILESLNSALGGPLIRQLSTSLGESEEGTRSAVRSIGSTMLAGLMQQASTSSGATNLFRAVNDDRIDTGIVGKFSGILGNRGSVDSLSALGESLSGTVFGNRTGAVANAISAVTGVKPGSALSLLSMGLPILFGILRKYTTQNGLDSTGLASLLSGQRSSLEKVGLDNRITSALGFGSLSSLLDTRPGGAGAARPTPHAAATATPERRRSKAWLPWAIAAVVAALSVLFLSNRSVDDRGARTATSAPERSPERMRLASASTQVYFDSGQVTIDSEDRQRIASAAQTVKAQNRPVAITGYTDRTGDRDTNREVAMNRAVAVRDALVAEGVAESQIVMDPPAVLTGSGTDAEARRVDIEVR